MAQKNQSKIAVFGAGPAGLMAAEVLAHGGTAVTVYERMPSVGRKFLLAGRGGLNLTHGEDFGRFMTRYRAAEQRLRPSVEAFSPIAVRAWCEELGQETFVGSSGRVFPKAMKTSPLLRAWLARLRAGGVEFRLRHQWTGWNTRGALTFATPEGNGEVAADAVVLALGGASWPKLGSDGGWQEILRAAGIEIAPLVPANSGFIAEWTKVFSERFQGQPLKGIELAFGGERLRGELIVTRSGLEGGAIYALAPHLRDAITRTGGATLLIDLRPGVTEEAIEGRLSAARGKQSLSSFLRKSVGLPPVAIGLLQETAITRGQRLADMKLRDLAGLIKRLPVVLMGVAPVERAISTAGGICFDEIDERYMLRKKPGVFVAGEMLDWEAPTGGYLLQACFATGAAAGRGVLDWLKMKAH